MTTHLRQYPSGLLVPEQTGSPDYYRGHNSQSYITPPRLGFVAMPVLEFLNGQPWDDFALCWVHGLRPSSIRAVRGEETTNAILWRVTVRLNAENRIEEIYQEVEVGLRDRDRFGADLYANLRRRQAVEARNDQFGL